MQLSSCVPATHLETSGARLEVDDLLPLARHPKVLGLAEFMNFPRRCSPAIPACLAKLAAFQGRPIDGHAPLLRGLDLNGYLGAGVRTDHEATNAAEALEKLAKGMQILVREGSVSQGPARAGADHHRAPFALHRLLHRRPQSARHRRGGPSRLHHPHRDRARRAAARRLSRRQHFRRAHFRPRRPRPRRAGLARRSRRARRSRILRGVAGDHRPGASSTRRCSPRARAVAPVGRRSVKARRVTASDFAARGQGPSTQAIGVVARQDHHRARAGRRCLSPTACAAIDLDQDLVKVAVVARHGVNDNIAVAFVHGFGMKRGAIASSVGHDSHNITVVGADEADMAVAVNRLIEIEGGFVVAEGGRVIAELALPVAGLMSLMSFEEVREALIPLRAAAKSLGVVLRRAVPAGRLPAAAGDPAPEDHRQGPGRRRPVRVRARLRPCSATAETCVRRIARAQRRAGAAKAKASANRILPRPLARETRRIRRARGQRGEMGAGSPADEAQPIDQSW